MRLPRRLRRLLDPHTGIITGVKTAVRGADRQGLVRALMPARRLGLTRQHTATLGEIIAGRLDDRVDHPTASTGLVDLAQSLEAASLSPATWLMLENLSRTIGCFVASDSFSQRGHAMIATHGSSRQRFLGHLHARNLEGAVAVWDTTTSGAQESPAWRQAGHYLWLWSLGQYGRSWFSSDERFVGLVSNSPITVMGPAASSLTTSDVPDESKTARVIMQDVLSWDPATDALGGACELAYASRETRNWIRESHNWDRLACFDAVSFRLESDGGGFPSTRETYFRIADDPRGLMLGGSSPNMIPLMVWDLLRAPGVNLTLAGTTFFASALAYTEGNRRFKHTVKRATDETGSTGELFERCPTFARHNVTENLTLVANLILSGAIALSLIHI